MTGIRGEKTIVPVSDLAACQSEAFIVLGARVFSAGNDVLRYLTPVGEARLNRKVGEETELEVDGVRHRHRIEKIEPYKSA